MSNLGLFSKLFINLNKPMNFNYFSPIAFQAQIIQARHYRKELQGIYKDFYKRRCLQGPEEFKSRHTLLNWDYNAELFSFGQRLHEQFDQNLLMQAFTDRSYLKDENGKRMQSLESGGKVNLDSKTNKIFAEKGKEKCVAYIFNYIHEQLPRLPDEALNSICEYLMDNSIHHRLMKEIGGDVLILSEYINPGLYLSSECFCAMMYTVPDDKFDRFIEDILISQLRNKELSELWTIDNPVARLNKILTRREEVDGNVEFRILNSTGVNTILASYQVGVYKDKRLIGRGCGETVSLAEENAAVNILEYYYGFTPNNTPVDVQQSQSTA